MVCYTRYSVFSSNTMQVFFLITLAHLIEHMAQAWELWVLNWARPDCLGLLGLLSPWLMKSEWLHYGYALFMLIGLWALRPYIKSGKAYFWWSVALWLQFYHHIEHALLLGQKLFGVNFFNSPVPISIGQIWFPRLELHLFYNLMVFVPMMVAVGYHYRLNQIRN